jgi:hypothetical protein
MTREGAGGKAGTGKKAGGDRVCVLVKESIGWDLLRSFGLKFAYDCFVLA